MEDAVACATCSLAMTPLGCSHTGLPLHHCCRCGTLRTCDGIFLVPDLVRRCRDFANSGLSADADPVAVAEWERLGVAEAINKVEDR